METGFKAFFYVFGEENKMCTQKRVNSREKLKSSQKKKSEGKTTRRLQSVCDTSDICDKCDLGTQQQQGLTHEEHRSVCYDSNTSVRIVVQMCRGRSAFWRLTIMCDAIFEMHTTCRRSEAPAEGKFWFWGKVLQVSDESTSSRFAENSLRWWANIKGRSFWKRRLRYILVCWDYMSSSRTKKTIDTQRRVD